jgi:hypothetical protein
MAAKMAYPDRQVVLLVGDGGFSMLMSEFAPRKVKITGGRCEALKRAKERRGVRAPARMPSAACVLDKPGGVKAVDEAIAPSLRALNGNRGAPHPRTRIIDKDVEPARFIPFGSAPQPNAAPAYRDPNAARDH